MDKFDWFKDKFQHSLFDNEQIGIYNRYCDLNGIEEHMYPMSDINEFFKNCTPSEILSSVEDCKFNVANKYFLSVRGRVTSFNYPCLSMSGYLYDIYKCKEAWEELIDEAGYFNEIYQEFYNEKPQDMDNDEYHKLIQNAVEQYEFESDIVEYLKKNME